MPGSRLLRVAIAGLAIALTALAAGAGFRTQNLFRDQFTRHGKEFGSVSAQQYLKMAQQLRDSGPGRNILMSKRTDGGGSKFDRRRGWYVAYDGDGKIRTFFIPKDGEKHFHRYAKGEPEKD